MNGNHILLFMNAATTIVLVLVNAVTLVIESSFTLIHNWIVCKLKKRQIYSAAVCTYILIYVGFKG